MTLTDLINIIIGLLLPIAVGYALIHRLCRHVSLQPLPTLAIAYGLGFGMLSQIMLVLGMMSIPYSRQIISLILIFILAILIYAIRWKDRSVPSLAGKHIHDIWDNPAAPSIRLDPSQKLLYFAAFFYISCSILFVFWRSMSIPVQEWDAVATSSFKAKIFFFDQSIQRLNLPHSPYPLHIPFAQTWIALNLTHWNDVLIKGIFPLAFVAYATLHYFYLKSRTNKFWALAGVCLLFSSNFFVYHATTAYSDLTMAYYNCTTIILLLLWNRRKDGGLLVLSALFGGSTTFVKLEGTGYLVICTFLLLLMLWEDKTSSLTEKFKNLLKFTIPSYGICALYHIYKFLLGISALHGRLKPLLVPEQLLRIPVIFREYISNLFFSGNWNLIWLILLISLITNRHTIKHQNETKLLSMTLAVFFGLYLIIPMTTSTLIDHPTLLSRVILHFFPLSILLITLLNYQNNQTLKRQHNN